MRESDIQRLISDYLKSCRLGAVKRVNTGCMRVRESGHPWARTTRFVRFGEVGHSDLVLELSQDPRIPEALRGRNAYFEVKTPSGKATAAQREFLASQRERGCIAEIVRSPAEVYAVLLTAGITGIPIPHEVAA